MRLRRDEAGSAERGKQKRRSMTAAFVFACAVRGHKVRGALRMISCI